MIRRSYIRCFEDDAGNSVVSWQGPWHEGSLLDEILRLLQENETMSDKTPLYVEDLIHVLGQSMPRGPEWHRAAKSLIMELRAFLPDKPTPAPSAPEAKFDNDDWVVIREGDVVGVQPWRVGNRSWVGDMPPTRRLWPLIDGDTKTDCYESHLLPIPPKPEKITDGYDLTSEVRPPKKDEWYVPIDGKDVERADQDWDYESSPYGGRRWIVKRNNKCTECGQEMPK